MEISMKFRCSKPKVKICGITSIEDAIMAANCGANAIGFIFYNDSPRSISASAAKSIVTTFPAFLSSVALFVDPSPEHVNEIIEQVKPDILQFHGNESAKFCEQFRRPYIKALRVHKNMDLIQSCSHYSQSRGILLDSHVEGSMGGSGVTFNWGIIPNNLAAPVILAGGLNPDNIRLAIKDVRPWAIDVCTGVEESPGVKDSSKMLAFFQGVENANE